MHYQGHTSRPRRHNAPTQHRYRQFNSSPPKNEKYCLLSGCMHVCQLYCTYIDTVNKIQTASATGIIWNAPERVI